MTPLDFILLLEAVTKLEHLISKYGEQVYGSRGSYHHGSYPIPHEVMNSWEAHAKTTDIKRICAIDPTSSPLEGADDTGYLEWVSNHLKPWGDYFRRATYTDPVPELPVETFKAGKYSEWLVKQYIKRGCPGTGEDKHVWAEDSDRLKEELTIYSRILTKLPVELRDINKIETLDHLYQVIKPFKKDLPQTAMQAMEGVITVLDEPGLQVFVPTTFAASRKLGTKTRWCTAASGGERHFKQYTDQGPLIVVSMEDDTGEVQKYQLHFPTYQCMDADNRDFSLEKLQSLMPNLAGTITRAHEMVGASPTSSIMAAAALRDEKALESIAPAFFADPEEPCLSARFELPWWAFAHLAHRKLIPIDYIDSIPPNRDGARFYSNRFDLVFGGFGDTDLIRLFSGVEDREFVARSLAGYQNDSPFAPVDRETLRDFVHALPEDILDYIKAVAEASAVSPTSAAFGVRDWTHAELFDAIYSSGQGQTGKLPASMMWLRKVALDAYHSTTKGRERDAAFDECVSAINKIMGAVGKSAGSGQRAEVTFSYPYEKIKEWLRMTDLGGEFGSSLDNRSSLRDLAVIARQYHHDEEQPACGNWLNFTPKPRDVTAYQQKYAENFQTLMARVV